MSAPPLDTPRLLLRPLSLDDADQVQALFPQWDVVRPLNGIVPWPYPPDGALTYIRDIALPAVGRGDEWIWTLRLKSDPDRVIGSIGLKRSENENRGFGSASVARPAFDDGSRRGRDRLPVRRPEIPRAARAEGGGERRVAKDFRKAGAPNTFDSAVFGLRARSIRQPLA